VTGRAFWCFGLTRHLLGIHVLPVRETLYSKFAHLCRETYASALRIDRRFVTNNTHLAGGIRKIFCVTFNTRGVTREYRSDIVIRTLVTKTAILCFGLVLGSSVIERRRFSNDRRFLDIER